jgi:hypothetical protein
MPAGIDLSRPTAFSRIIAIMAQMKRDAFKKISPLLIGPRKVMRS